MRHDEIEQSIRQNEQWLAGQLPEPSDLDISALQRRVRIEIDQVWLAGEIVDVEPPNLIQNTCQTVRKALADRSQVHDSKRRIFPIIIRWGTGVGVLAACLAIYFMRAPEMSTVPPISALAAFEQYEDDTRLEEFVSLKHELSAFSFYDSAGDVEEETEPYDSLLNSINSLDKPQGWSDDWS